MELCDILIILAQSEKKKKQTNIFQELAELDLHDSNVAAIKDLLYVFIANNEVRWYDFNST